MSDLAKRLRESPMNNYTSLMRDASNYIDTLEAENKALREMSEEWKVRALYELARAEAAERQLLEATSENNALRTAIAKRARALLAKGEK